jgi:hypothetical protein
MNIVLFDGMHKPKIYRKIKRQKFLKHTGICDKAKTFHKRIIVYMKKHTD